MDDKEINAYKEGFMNALDIKQNMKWCIFGMDGSQVLDILDKHVRSKQEKIEIVSSPRPVDRDHLKRDFKSVLEDMETSLRHLRYMYEEL